MDIEDEVTVLSKASNDSVTTSVPEDAHEKLTFIVALRHEYIAAEMLRTGKKKVKVVTRPSCGSTLGAAVRDSTKPRANKRLAK